MSEISALISLLDDPDDTIFTEIKGRILSLGGDIIPELENTFERKQKKITPKLRVF